MLGLAPPIWIDLEHGFYAWLMALDNEGPCAVLMQRGIARGRCGSRRRSYRVVLLSPLLVHDEPAVPLRNENGIRRIEHHVDCVVIHFVDFRVGRNDAGEFRTLVITRAGGGGGRGGRGGGGAGGE